MNDYTKINDLRGWNEPCADDAQECPPVLPTLREPLPTKEALRAARAMGTKARKNAKPPTS